MKKPKKTATMKRRANKVGRGKPKGPPPKALRSKPKRQRAVAPAPREVGLLDAIGEVMAVCEELATEMHEWADNMPESKQSSQKHDEVEAAAETLDDAVNEDPVVPEGMSFLNEIKIMIQDPTPSRRGRSRSTRLGDATSILLNVIDKLEDVSDGALKADHTGAQCDTARELKDACENIESNLQGVEFPGMFG